MTRHVLALAEIGLEDRLRAGGKAAPLGHLLQLGHPVPSGYCITVEGYERTAKNAGLAEILRSSTELGALDADLDPQRAESLAQRFEAALRELPDALWQEIRGAHSALSDPVAVRSSATLEDLEDASFAGQHETFLDVAGEDALKQAILGCFASLWSARALLYRHRLGLPHGEARIAVLVQEMVPAEIAGVLWTAHPLRGSRDLCLISTAAGLGQGVVDGNVAGDDYEVAKADASLRNSRCADPEHPLLDAAALAELNDLGCRVEEIFGAPRDIEWARAAGRFAILQARPITTLPDEEIPQIQPADLDRPKPPLSAYQRRVLGVLAQRYTTALRPADAEALGRGILAGAERTLRWLGHRGARLRPEDVFLLEDAVPIALYPRQRSPSWIGLVGGALCNAWALRFHDPARWRQEHAPALEAAAEDLEATAATLERLDGDTLVELLERANAQVAEVFFSRRLAYQTISLPERLRHRVLAIEPERGEALCAELLAYAEHATADAHRALAELAEEARRQPAVRRALYAPDPAARLTGDPFLSSFEDFLEHYGALRFTPFGPSWGEEPRAVWATLRGLAQSPPPAELAHEAPEHALAHCLARLPAFRRPAFRRLVERARACEAMREDSHFLIARASACGHRALREAGRRLAERGSIERRDDVFFLLRDELRRALRESKLPTSEPSGLHPLVERRQALFAAVERDGLLPPGWLPDRDDGGLQLRGQGVSGGVAEGVARCLESAADISRLGPGEILVVRSPTPTWTVLFGLAGAVVAESGGVAAHAAVVAREYGIPAVMNVAGAFTRIPDGRPLRVDGGSGTVRLLEG